MAFLTGSMGEPDSREDDPCPRCKARMELYGVAPFYCSLDGTVEAIDKCFAEAKARRAQIEEDWEWQGRGR